MLLHEVRKLCVERNLSIAELEKLLGFANGSIGKWDKTSPSIERVTAVANYFEVSVDYLVNEDEKKRLSSDVKKLITDYDSLNTSQKALVKCYITLIKNEQVIYKEE